MRSILILISCLAISLVSDAQIARNVRLLCNWRDTAQCPRNGGGQYWSDVWGFVNNGKEYAVIGGTAGAHIIDIDACTEVAFLPGRSQGASHRDYKTFGHYLYAVCDEGYATMQVFDFSKLPGAMPLVWESTLGDLSRSHNIFIDTAKARLYCASATNTSTGHDNIRVYSLADPTHPQYLASINAFTNTHDLYVRNDTAWCSNSFGGYLMLDMSALPDYRVIGALTNYPYQGFNHSSWIGPNYIGVMADETFGKPLKVIDTHNPGKAITVLATFSPRGTDTTSIPHNPYLLGHYALISYYMDGLQIYDLSDPRHPVQSGYYDTYPGQDVQGFYGAWGCYPYLPSRRILVSDMQTGLYVLNAEEAMGRTIETGFTVFPNPTNGQLWMLLPTTVSGPVDIAIYNSAGGVVYRGAQALAAGENAALRVSLPTSMPAGFYVFRAIGGGQSFSARFIKR